MYIFAWISDTKEEENQGGICSGKRKEKVMWCLTILVLTAVAIGAAYYVMTNLPPSQQNKGYLIRKAEDMFYGC